MEDHTFKSMSASQTMYLIDFEKEIIERAHICTEEKGIGSGRLWKEDEYNQNILYGILREKIK